MVGPRQEVEDLLDSLGSALFLKRRPGRAFRVGNTLPWLYSSIMGPGGGRGSSRSLLRLSPGGVVNKQMSETEAL